MKLVFTFLLSLFFLLVRGHDHLHAHSSYDRSSYSPIKIPEKLGQGGVASVKDGESVIRKENSSGADDDLISATELEDDDELISPRKFVDISNYFITLYYAHASAYLDRSLKNRLPFCKHFPYTSSDKYIIQRVIRV